MSRTKLELNIRGSPMHGEKTTIIKCTEYLVVVESLFVINSVI